VNPAIGLFLLVTAIVYPMGMLITAVELAYPYHLSDKLPGRQRLLQTVFWPYFAVRGIYRHFRRDW
jgi:hypothetical protein